MEDWQLWQIRADEIAASLNQDVDSLDHDFFDSATEVTFRAFWPRFRELKERVRVAPAIKLDDKLNLERRLRGLGSRAYKAQEVTYARSGDAKAELLAAVAELRARAEPLDAPRALRDLRREIDVVRRRFENGHELVPADRQQVWDAWKEANQFVWQRLTDLWNQNETYLREILDTARHEAESGDGQAARQAVARFFEALRTHEARQASIDDLKGEADRIRRKADQVNERKTNERNERERNERKGVVRNPPAQAQPAGSAPIEGWRSEVDRNRDTIERLQSEVDSLDHEFQTSTSILEQAMIRGNLVDKRRKLSELEHSTKTLEQRIEQSEVVPLITAG